MDHSPEFLNLVDQAKADVREVSIAETLKRLENGAKLIDVREDNEFETEHAAGAEHIGRGVIERDIRFKHPDKNEQLILYCGGGYRSTLAAANLQKMGYANVWSMTGGWTAWKDNGAPVEEGSK